MRVLIFEPDHTGHHLNYVRLLIQALPPLGCELIIALGEQAFGSAEFAQHLKAHEKAVSFDRLRAIVHKSPIQIMMRNCADFDESMQRVRPDHVIVPYADGLTQGLGMRRLRLRRAWPDSVRGEALLMRGGHAYPQSSFKGRLRARASVVATALSPWDRIHHLDPIPFELIQKRGGSLAARSRLIPDPVPEPRITDRAEARRRLGIPGDGRYLGCVGMLDSRKGIDRLIRAFAAASLAPVDRLLLVGKCAQDVRALLDGEFRALVGGGRIVAIDRYCSDEEFEAGIAAMDLVCAPYPRHVGSASIAIRAASMQRPVLGSNWGWLGWVVPRFGLGATCDAMDHEVLVKAIPRSLEQAGSFQLPEAGRRFVRFHSIENFQACWTSLLRERLGLPQSDALRSWEWVMEATQTIR